MTDPTILLAALQHGDSFFPGGGFAASWGLETLFTDTYVHDAETLLHFVQGQLCQRWGAVRPTCPCVVAPRDERVGKSCCG